jgi:hypothetical protein
MLHDHGLGGYAGLSYERFRFLSHDIKSHCTNAGVEI